MKKRKINRKLRPRLYVVVAAKEEGGLFEIGGVYIDKKFAYMKEEELIENEYLFVGIARIESFIDGVYEACKDIGLDELRKDGFFYLNCRTHLKKKYKAENHGS